MSQSFVGIAFHNIGASFLWVEVKATFFTLNRTGAKENQNQNTFNLHPTFARDRCAKRILK